MITLPFSSLPGTSDLFNDYCENHSDIRKFFIGHYTDILAYETQMSFLAKRTYHRERLTSILYEQNQHFRSGERTFRNIEQLKSPETFAVVTGQQVGLLTGPLYTIYKALTAVHLADWLKDHFPHHEFVPVFWMETEDHDIDEANQAGILDKQNAYLTVRNGEIDPEVKNYLPVGGLKLGETVQELFSALKESLQPTDFSEKLFADLEAVYNPDATYAEGFAGMMNRLLGDRGIIFVDPSDLRLKQITSTLAQHELETFPTTSEEVIKV
ncbi:MAG: hypothetical protein CL946_07110, partial [Ectothiorhodospiraceae bacterium]|nr:hypothetical protein [Ectothiorhodospiraceae bacterium]